MRFSCDLGSKFERSSTRFGRTGNSSWSNPSETRSFQRRTSNGISRRFRSNFSNFKTYLPNYHGRRRRRTGILFEQRSVRRRSRIEVFVDGKTPSRTDFFIFFFQHSAAEKILETNLQSFGRRENFEFSGFRLRSAHISTDADLRDGRNRRCSRFQECFDRRSIHQRKNEKRSFCEDLFLFWTTRFAFLQAQFIVISLRENMFTLADYLIGIYKVNNCSQTASLRPVLFAKKLEERRRQNTMWLRCDIFSSVFDRFSLFSKVVAKRIEKQKSIGISGRTRRHHDWKRRTSSHAKS